MFFSPLFFIRHPHQGFSGVTHALCVLERVRPSLLCLRDLCCRVCDVCVTRICFYTMCGWR